MIFTFGGCGGLARRGKFSKGLRNGKKVLQLLNVTSDMSVSAI